MSINVTIAGYKFRTKKARITIQINYCIEGTEMRQLGFKVRRLLFLNRY